MLRLCRRRQWCAHGSADRIHERRAHITFGHNLMMLSSSLKLNAGDKRLRAASVRTASVASFPAKLCHIYTNASCPYRERQQQSYTGYVWNSRNLYIYMPSNELIAVVVRAREVCACVYVCERVWWPAHTPDSLTCWSLVSLYFTIIDMAHESIRLPSAETATNRERFCVRVIGEYRNVPNFISSAVI